jgi:hypothetical protein
LLIIFTARRLDRWGTRALGLVSLTGADADGEAAEGSTTSDERGCLRRAAVWESGCRLWLGVAMVWEEWCLALGCEVVLRSCSRTGRKVRARQELEVPDGLGRFP